MFLKLAALLIVLIATSNCGVLNLDFAPQVLTRVQVGNNSVAVWKHKHDNVHHFFVSPMAVLVPESFQTTNHVLTDEHMLEFKVVMYDELFFKSVVEHLHVLKGGFENVTVNDLSMIPMTKQRIVFKRKTRKPLIKGVILDENWVDNFHSKASIKFRFFCDSSEICENLKAGLSDRPEVLQDLTLESVVEAEKWVGRSLIVNGTNLASTEIYSRLENLNTTGSIRYLSSEDTKRLAAEAASGIVAKVITHGGYVSNGEEMKVSEAIEMVLQKQKVETVDFDDHKWESVFWNDDFARPDRITHTLNDAMNKVLTEKDKLSKSSSDNGVNRGGSGSTGEGFWGILKDIKFTFDVGVKDMKSNENKTFEKFLEENNEKVEFNGEKFVTKPMVLNRVNLNELSTKHSLTSISVQVQEVLETIPTRIVVRDFEEFYDPPKIFIERLERKFDEKLMNVKLELSKLNEMFNGSFTELESILDNEVSTMKTNPPEWFKSNLCLYAPPHRMSCPSGFLRQKSTITINKKSIYLKWCCRG